MFRIRLPFPLNEMQVRRRISAKFLLKTFCLISKLLFLASVASESRLICGKEFNFNGAQGIPVPDIVMRFAPPPLHTLVK